MSLRTCRKRLRTKNGSVLVLAILVLAFLLIPASMLLFRYTLLLTTKACYQQSIESAALLVADQESKIIVNDPHFGFVSLSNQPPIGKATTARDGEPCPVSSINNLLATIRLDTILAHKWNDANMCELAAADYKQAQKTCVLLQSALQSSIDPDDGSGSCDMNGNSVSPYIDAQTLLTKNLQNADCGRPAQVRNLRVSLGWLSTGGITNTPLPDPVELAQLGPDSQQNGKYKSCIDIPAYENSYFFAASAKSTALADQTAFVEPDGKRFCSVVKVEADISFHDINPFEHNSQALTWLHVTACAIPADRAQEGPTGALLVMFPCGVRDLRCLDDLLHLPGGEVTQSYQSVNGDLNVDPSASIIPANLQPWSGQDINSSRLAASGLYCWLRAAGVRPRIDSATAALCQNFNSSLKSSNLIYEFDANGNVVISSLPSMPLPLSVLSDSQIFVEAGSDHHCLRCYNNVYNLGTINGGKHAGQPMEGDPINWCELPYYGLSTDTACREGKGAATGLSVSGYASTTQTQIPGAIARDGAAFQVNRRLVAATPRKSYYSGGLAVELSISQF